IVVNVAVYLGYPTTLSLQITNYLFNVLVPLLGGLVIVGTIAGLIGTIPTIRVYPHKLFDRHQNRISSIFDPPILGGLRPQLLSIRTIIPTAATLAVFVAVVLVVVAIVGTLSPLIQAGEQTVIENTASHPIASTVSTDYDRILRSVGYTV
ncbi:MAG: hypothetical protein ABEI86_02640, partial [Halobacteriaceae archaeon]